MVCGNAASIDVWCFVLIGQAQLHLTHGESDLLMFMGPNLFVTSPIRQSDPGGRKLFKNVLKKNRERERERTHL